MKIKSIDIASFGKLKNYRLELSDGLNVIFGENEKGKSTIMAFVRMMFYGSTGKNTDIKSPRKKYRPWNSDLMAGSLTFEHEGVTYKLEREFKATNSTDKISLINLDTNEKQTLSGNGDVGAKFFGLTDGAFERSVFISEPALSAKNELADGEINARLSNIATTSDDDVSFEKVFARVKGAKEELLSRGGKKGKLDKANATLEELNEKIKMAKQAEEKVLVLKGSAELKENEINESSKKASELFDQLKNSDKIKKRNFVLRYIEAEKERAAAKEKLAFKDGGFADKAYISLLKEMREKVLDLGNKIDENVALAKDKKKDIDALNTALSSINTSDNAEVLALEEKRDGIDKNIEDIKAQNDQLQTEISAQKPIKKNNLALIIIGVIITLLGVAGFFILSMIGLAQIACLGAVILGQILFVLGFIIKVKVMPDTADISAKISENSASLNALLKDKEAILEEISKIKAQNNALEIEVASKAALIKDKQADLETLLKETENLAGLKATAEGELTGAFGALKALNGNAEETISALENALGFYDMISEKITVLADNAACSSLEEAEAKLETYNKDGTIADLNNEEIDALKEKFRTQSNITSTLKTELTAINEQIKSATAATPSVAVLEREKEELCANIKAYSEYTEISDIALTTLDEAFRDLRKNYSEVLDQRTAEIFTKLASNKYLSVSVSKSMELAVTTEDAFGTKEAEYLSSGTEDQLYLAMRLAIAELITNEGEKLPIFADDPFSQYDDGRVANATVFLKDYAKDKQIVMFTCHSAIKEVAEKLDIKTFEM
ncbi:MAG: AAA family ATPase [Clostridia bacterium]|nr:AAA family ATPase [Clostridia bacterium]